MRTRYTNTPGSDQLPLEAKLALANLCTGYTVARDNPHGADWQLTAVGDNGPDSPHYDRYFAQFESQAGQMAVYFYFGGTWSLGAN